MDQGLLRPEPDPRRDMTSAMATAPRRSADSEPLCPLRPGTPCTLCFPGASGPQNCGRVYLVMSDPELRADLLRRWAEYELG
jgi:hypothetical protein